MVLFNETGFIYSIVSAITQNITGNDFLTLLFLIAGFVLFAFAFRIPLEFTIIFVFPLLIAFGAKGGEAFMPVLGVGIIYLSVIFAKNFFFWK